MKIEKPKELKKQTKRRKQRMKKEFSKKFNVTVFENSHNYDQIIAQVGIPVTALCEHHEVAIHGTVSIAYIPDKYLVGLSKLARIAEKWMNPTVKTLQEKATHQILKELVKEVKPKGAMVIVKAVHDCIAHRGVKKPSLTITSAIYGIFEDFSNGARQEFLELVNSNER
jgi:GTP cyclohydrolase I